MVKLTAQLDINITTTLVVLIIVIVGFLIDQISKLIISTKMEIGESKRVFRTPLRITHIRNHSGPMGILEDRIWLVNLVFGLVVILNFVLLFFADISEAPLYTVGVSLMFAGNLGNLFCKLFRDCVVDFIDLGFSIPNIADFLLAGGFCLTAISIFL